MDRLTAKFVGSEQQAQWDCTEIKCDNCGGAFDYSILRASSDICYISCCPFSMVYEC